MEAEATISDHCFESNGAPADGVGGSAVEMGIAAPEIIAGGRGMAGWFGGGKAMFGKLLALGKLLAIDGWL